MIPQLLEEEIKQALKSFRVPGCQLIIFQNDEHGSREYLEAFGSIDLEGERAMTIDTRIPIGSNTKLFTVLALLPLLRDHGYDIDTPIGDILPESSLSEEMKKWTCKDICTHMTGVPLWEKWFGFEDRNIGVDEVIENLKILPPTYALREKFQYSNLPFAIISLIVSKLSNQSFENYIKEKLLDPLEVGSTSFRMDDNLSMGHWSRVDDDGKIEMNTIEFGAEHFEAYGPPGGLISNGKDLLRWLKYLSISSDYLKTSQPIIKEGFNSHSYPFERATYGLCLAQTTYRGMKVIEHVGNSPGYRNLVCDLPAQGIKFGVLSNGSEVEGSVGFRDWVRLRLFTHFGGFEGDGVCVRELLGYERRITSNLRPILGPIEGSATPPILGTFTFPGLTTLYLDDTSSMEIRPRCTTIPWGSGFYGNKRAIFTFIDEDENGTKKYEGCWELILSRTGETMFGEPFVAYLEDKDDGYQKLRIVEWVVDSEGVKSDGASLKFSA